MVRGAKRSTDPNTIGNRVKRSQVAAKQKREKNRESSKARKSRKREKDEYERVTGKVLKYSDDEDSEERRRKLRRQHRRDMGEEVESSPSPSPESSAGEESGFGSSDDDEEMENSDGEDRKKKKMRKPKLLKPRTIDSEREHDETVVQPGDEEVEADEALDEFAKYFRKEEENPRVLLTTSRKPSAKCYAFMMELVNLFPGVEFYPRGTYNIKEIIGYANNRGYSNVMILNEDAKKVNGMWLVHLPEGPTAKFKVSNTMLKKQIPNSARPGSSVPEVILNNFSTRLGHTVGRLFASLFPPAPEFRGRRVVTFHNQRDFIFIRHHRYVFDSLSKARIQECGPRFTLKLRSLQHGTFNTSSGEYEWIHKREMETSRRRFFL